MLHALDIFLSKQFLVTVLLALVSWLFWVVFVPPKRLYGGNKLPVIQSRFGGLGAVGFFANRYDFLTEKMTKDTDHPHHGIAKFNLLDKIVYTVGSTDEDTIRAIALNRDLSFSQGNAFLFAGIQGAGQKGLVDGGEMDAEEKKEMKALAMAISPQRLTQMRPQLVSDALEALNSWLDGKEATTIDLQQSYYPLIFRYTVRLMGMTEYARSPKQLSKLMTAFWRTQKNSGFWTTILPWIPQPRLLIRLYGAITLWWMVRQSVALRIKEGRREDDWAQTLIDQKQPNSKISRWVIGGLLAGILNTIGTGAYTIAFLGADPELRKKARDNVLACLRKSAEARGDIFEDLSLLEALQGVTLEEWEKDFEILHLCFKESIRLNLTNSLNRYYPGPSLDTHGKMRPRLVLGGEEIEDDTYIAFSPPSNLHDATAFPEPFKFDPFRYHRGQGETEYTYLGWGVGHHKCTGMRFAKMETIVAIATLLAHADFRTVNQKGIPYGPQEVPLPNLSQGHWRTPTKPMRVEITRRRDAPE